MRLALPLVAAVLWIGTLPAMAVELVMVEQPGCAYCRQWDREVADAYPKTAEGRAAPLARVQMRALDDSGYAFARPVNYTPTFVLVDDKRELARIEGYPGEDFFWGLLGMMLKAQTDFDPKSAGTGESVAQPAQIDG